MLLKENFKFSTISLYTSRISIIKFKKIKQKKILIKEAEELKINYLSYTIKKKKKKKKQRN